MVTLEDLKNELEPYKNTLVIGLYQEVMRLVDVIEDEVDYYWVVDTYKGILHYSCCGCGWIPLKGFIKDGDYDQLVRIWNLNNEEKAI